MADGEPQGLLADSKSCSTLIEVLQMAGLFERAVLLTEEAHDDECEGG
jgi:hypothetical protein